MKLACTFTITAYGHSGNELPPPVESTYVKTVISFPDERQNEFRIRMQVLGEAVRKILDTHLIAPYSCQKSCDWRITEIGTESDILKRSFVQ